MFGKKSSVRVFAEMLALTIGSTMIIRLLVERKWYIMRWKSFWPGDLYLAEYMLCVNEYLKDYKPDDSKFYHQKSFFWSIVLFAYGYFGYAEYAAVPKLRPSLKQNLDQPSQIAHFVASGIAAGKIGVTILPLLKHTPKGKYAKFWRWLAIYYLLSYVACGLQDALVESQKGPIKQLPDGSWY